MKKKSNYKAYLAVKASKAAVKPVKRATGLAKKARAAKMVAVKKRNPFLQGILSMYNNQKEEMELLISTTEKVVESK